MLEQLEAQLAMMQQHQVSTGDTGGGDERQGVDFNPEGITGAAVSLEEDCQSHDQHVLILLQMRQNASGGPVRPSLPNGPIINSLPSPNPSLHPTRPHLGPPRPLCPPQPVANGPVGPGTHRLSDPLPVETSSSNSSSKNQPGPTATGPNGDVPYLQPAGSGDAALLPHTCTSTQTQDATPRQALHLNSSQVRARPVQTKERYYVYATAVSVATVPLH